MPRAATATPSRARPARRTIGEGRSEFVKLERRLVLVSWFNHLLGYESNRDLLRDMKETAEGFDSQGRSHIYHHLLSRGDRVRIEPLTLAAYDDNIKRHLDAMNRHRAEPIQLRYFQHLAVLFTEVFLDRYFHHRATFLADLNEFVNAHNASLPPGDEPYPRFEQADLDKLAFWMATGSGKTLIMHLNYRQFLHYNREPLDNILLITPNEGMTEQHLAEMELSSVPCERFQQGESGLGLADRDVVRVIEIHKLVEEKKGAGVSVPVEAFEGNNLIFVDEGHKGSGGEEWRKRRDELGRTGFTFEYSATFGQAFTAARHDALTEEYGKAIVFDYSYKYFYDDGFGKDFHVLNLREDTSEDMTDTLLLANLLSFYQQRRCYREQAAAIKPYNLDPPLWIFVGSSVNAVYRESGQPRSDVLTVARFLHRFLRNERGWATRRIAKILSGKSGLRDDDGNDVFDGPLRYLQELQAAAETLYGDILRAVFHADTSAGLHMASIRGSQGELGLRAGPTSDYFGVVYIGDPPAFRKLVEADAAGIILDPDDAFADSLFAGINAADSRVNVLIGAKKFMEGWSSWRVSNMGLLNIGRAEGSEIIQLFGRGVRLRGRDFSLKRSAALGSDGAHPPNIRLLETLDIFAVRANYMAQFRDYLEREGIDPGGRIELTLPIRRKDEFLGKGLLTLRLSPGKENDFFEKHYFVLDAEPAAQVKVDLSPRLEAISSSQRGLQTASATAGETIRFDSKCLGLLDWERIYLDLLEYKESKGYHNLVMPRESLRTIIEQEDRPLYELVATKEVAEPDSFAGLAETERAVLAVLRSYVDELYAVHRKRWEDENLSLVRLTDKDGNLSGREYTVRISRSDRELIRQVEELARDLEGLSSEWRRGPLRNVYFDRHLYQPLLALMNADLPLQVEPQGLEQSGQQFVASLKDYLEKPASRTPKTKVFLLRNQGRGKGVGFYGKQGHHYPDFILWVKTGNRQRIVFVEPHGMLHESAPGVDDKLKLPKRLKRLEQQLNAVREGGPVELDYFIISATPYEALRKTYGEGDWDKAGFAAAHILFAEDDYVPALFSEPASESAEEAHVATGSKEAQ